jgi:hypothetical protein
MSNEPANTTIQDRYAARLAADLENNAQEQEDVRSKIADWQTHLAQLEKEHAWLSTLQGTVTGESPVAEEQPTAPEQAAQPPGGSAEDSAAQAATSQAVPQPRRARKTTGQPGKSRKKTPQAEPANTTKAAKTTEPAEKTQPDAKKDEPPLRVLILEVLTQHYQPRTAREITTEVKQAHPDRHPSDQVVRNSLNALLAKGKVQREQQQNSVYYTAVGKEDETETLPEQAPADPVPADA